jgi:hypothetical protein
MVLLLVTTLSIAVNISAMGWRASNLNRRCPRALPPARQIALTMRSHTRLCLPEHPYKVRIFCRMLAIWKEHVTE